MNPLQSSQPLNGALDGPGIPQEILRDVLGHKLAIEVGEVLPIRSGDYRIVAATADERIEVPRDCQQNLFRNRHTGFILRAQKLAIDLQGQTVRNRPIVAVAGVVEMHSPSEQWT